MTGEGVNTIIVQMFDGKGVVAWTHGNSGGRLLKQGGGGGAGVTWVNFCCVCAIGLSEPLPHCSLFCGQL